MPIISQNPATEEILGTYPELSSHEITSKITKSNEAFKTWGKTSFAERQKHMMNLGLSLRTNKDVYAELITQEMGMPINQALSEIEKIAWIAEFYADNAEQYLKPERTEIGFSQSYVSFEPLGTILVVGPWNFPFYLALRSSIPAIMAGNTVLLKHASNVPQISITLEDLFLKSGFPVGVFQHLMIGSSKVAEIIKDPRVHMIALTGSEQAGTEVAKIAAAEIKKVVLELGGSDPFIVLKDADLAQAAEAGALSRLRNGGQSCNAAKRFILQEEIAEQFLKLFKTEFQKVIVGDPTDPKTEVGPLASLKSVQEIERQLQESVDLGAQIVMGGKRLDQKGFYFEPTIVTNITQYMPLYQEEIFGPVAPIIIVQSVEEAIQVANNSNYGLGASLWTKDMEQAAELIPQIEAGNVYINSMVRSDPRMPYGGIKRSGYGREFSHYGIKEFVNIKSVAIK